jgi:drug/metabolite transporter (DMT)-like permease
MAFLYLLEPIWTAILAILYLKEYVPLASYVAGGMIICGAFLQWYIEAKAPTSSSYSQH